MIYYPKIDKKLELRSYEVYCKSNLVQISITSLCNVSINVVKVPMSLRRTAKFQRNCKLTSKKSK